MTQGLIYLSFCCKIKEFMLGGFYSISIIPAVVFLSQNKSWKEEREFVAGDIAEDIRVEIRGVSWISWAERVPRRSWGCARGAWSKTSLPTRTDIDSKVGGV